MSNMLEFPSPSFNSTESPDGTYKNLTILEVLKRPKVFMIFFLLLVLIFSSIFCNLVVCYTIYATRRLQYAAYYLVASLAVSDFGVGLFVIPVSLAYNVTFEMKGKWVFGLAACDAWIFANFWFCCASVFNLCAVTWDRYVAVTSSLRYSVRMSTPRVIGIIIATWTLSFLASLINFYGIKITKTRTLCEIKEMPLSFVIYNFIILYFVPVSAIMFVNGKLWIIATRQINRTQLQVLSLAIVPVGDNTPPIPRTRQTRNYLNSKSTAKTFRTFLILISSYVCCTTPFFVMALVESLVTLPGFVLYLSVILTYVNSATNPWIYGIWNKGFRDCAVLACQKRLFRKKTIHPN